ncbi:MAG: hypothetical protein V4538_01775 [Bacteroidota bacterium]
MNLTIVELNNLVQLAWTALTVIFLLVIVLKKKNTNAFSFLALGKRSKTQVLEGENEELKSDISLLELEINNKNALLNLMDKQRNLSLKEAKKILYNH